MTALEWTLDHQNLCTFVMIDGSGNEVTGLDGALTILIAKAGGAFAAASGTQGEMGNGWYKYEGTAGEADTVGPVSIVVTGAGAIQQNLEYVIGNRSIYAKEFTYTVTNSVTLQPEQGATVTITTDVAGDRVVFSGVTDAFGVLRHISTGMKPWLDPGPYYFWTFADGFTANNPDLETVT